MKQFVRCIYDACGDLPKSIIGRRGELVSRNKKHDETGLKAWNIRFSGWKGTKVLWEDEFTRLEQS
jgi:hypothetical protein